MGRFLLVQICHADLYHHQGPEEWKKLLAKQEKSIDLLSELDKQHKDGLEKHNSKNTSVESVDSFKKRKHDDYSEKKLKKAHRHSDDQSATHTIRDDDNDNEATKLLKSRERAKQLINIGNANKNKLLSISELQSEVSRLEKEKLSKNSK